MKKTIILILSALLLSSAVMAAEKQLTWKYVSSSGTGDKCETPDINIPGYSVYDYAIIQSMTSTGMITASLCDSKSNELIMESEPFAAGEDVVMKMYIHSLSGGSVYLGVDGSNW